MHVEPHMSKISLQEPNEAVENIVFVPQMFPSRTHGEQQ